jgi:predicted Zn-dependent protease
MNELTKRSVFVISVFVLFYQLSLSFAQEAVDLDYFDARLREKAVLIEKYHLSADNFFKHYRAGDLGNAQNELRFVLRYFPNHPTALLLMGSIARLKKAPALAMPYYQRALDLYPQHALTHAQYGAYLVDVGLTNDGINRLEQAIKMEPNLAQGHKWLAVAYNKIGQVELGRQAAERAKELESRKQSDRVPASPQTPASNDERGR